MVSVKTKTPEHYIIPAAQETTECNLQLGERHCCDDKVVSYSIIVTVYIGIVLGVSASHHTQVNSSGHFQYQDLVTSRL